MSVIKVTKVRYRIECNGCGLRGPEAYGREEARFRAEKEGWKSFFRQDKHARIVTDLCPLCVAKHKEAS